MQCLLRYQYTDSISRGKEAPVPARFARVCRENAYGQCYLMIGFVLFRIMYKNGGGHTARPG